jgi:hypothetical protein
MLAQPASFHAHSQARRVNIEWSPNLDGSVKLIFKRIGQEKPSPRAVAMIHLQFALVPPTAVDRYSNAWSIIPK